MKKLYRDNGTIGALLDEYEKAVNELKSILDGVSREQLVKIVDNETRDPDCRSIQTILTHVIQSGYSYVLETRKWKGEEIAYRRKQALQSVEEYKSALDEMFRFNEELFVDYPKLKLIEKDPAKKMTVRWGQVFDPEQIMSHAIVHVLKHRRQIERFIQKMNA